MESHLHQGVADFYQKARKAATVRNEARLAYQNERYDQGLHPDTHPEFWDEWVEHEMPEFPKHSLKDRMSDPFFVALLVMYAVVGGTTILAFWGVRKFLRRSQTRPV